jgi:cyclophilin family peptidyl-prolyl cis-trans isomerase
MRKILIVLLIIPVLLTACSNSTGGTSPVPTPSQTFGSLQWSTPPAMQIDTSKLYYATVDTTLGTFKIQLFANESPQTVNNFVFLSQQGFYNGVIFFRVIKTYIIQTGDPTGTGSGSPGYEFADELPPKHSYGPGIVAMANSGLNTNGSQFFICTGNAAASLNTYPNYTQFGKVIDGMDVVQKIAAVPVGPGNRGETSRPVNPPSIIRIDITEQ